MISQQALSNQVKNIKYRPGLWGRSEIAELANVLTPDEKLSQLVNGYYENGFALLAATDHRMLLIDKKVFGYLNVEDFRFDMINQLDYYHRLFNSSINVSAGPKNLHFISYNQKGLRDLLDSVQCRMIEIKEEKRRASELQQRKLDRLDRTLKRYIKAQLVQGMTAAQKGQGSSTAIENSNNFGYRYEPAPSRLGLLPRPRSDLWAARIAFAKLPGVISRRRRFAR